MDSDEGRVKREHKDSESDFSFSDEDVDPRVTDQFLQLATTLKETNENILTFQFMLAQYRKLARIEPFRKTNEETLEQSKLQHEIEITKDEKILEQLRLLTNAVNRIQTPSFSNQIQNQDLLSQELLEYKEKSAFLSGQFECIQKQFDEKSKLCDCLTESNQRLTIKLNEEKDKNLELDKKLENEKRAAAQIGKDITKYVNRMNDLESKLHKLSPNLDEAETQLQKTSFECEKHKKEIMELKQEVQFEKGLNSELLKGCEVHMSKCNKLESDLHHAYQKIQLLERRLGEELEPARSLTFNGSANDLCSSCLADVNATDTASKVERLALNVHSSAKETIESLIESREQNWMNRTDNFKSEPERSSRDDENHTKKGLKEIRKLEKDLNLLKIKHAELLASKECLDLEISNLKASLGERDLTLKEYDSKLQHLKSKSKILLRQYRAKRQAYHDQISKLENIRGCLVELRDLCKTKDENYRDILDHLGNQIQISARLIAAYVDTPYSREMLCLTGNTKLTTWFAAVQAITSWTHKQLLSFGRRLWGESVISRQKVLHRDADTLSEISHTLEHDSERDQSVLSLIDAQERISKTQKDSFSLLISKAKVSLP